MHSIKTKKCVKQCKITKRAGSKGQAYPNWSSHWVYQKYKQSSRPGKMRNRESKLDNATRNANENGKGIRR